MFKKNFLKFEAEKASDPYHLSILVKVRQSQKQRAQNSKFYSVFLGELSKQYIAFKIYCPLMITTESYINTLELIKFLTCEVLSYLIATVT